jgi:hypothetical protein
MWCGVVWCGMVWSGVVWYGTVRYGTVRYGTVRYGTVRYGTVRYGMVWYGRIYNYNWLLTSLKHMIVTAAHAIMTMTQKTKKRWSSLSRREQSGNRQWEIWNMNHKTGLSKGRKVCPGKAKIFVWQYFTKGWWKTAFLCLLIRLPRPQDALTPSNSTRHTCHLVTKFRSD